MSNDKTQEIGVIPIQIEEPSDEMYPLTRILVDTYQNAINRFESLTKDLDLETLEEPDRSGCILTRSVIKSFRRGNSPEYLSTNFFDQRELTETAVREIQGLVENLPGWIPILFNDFKEKFKSITPEQLRISTILIADDNVDNFFQAGDIFEFVNNCLFLSEKKEYLIEKQIGDKKVELLDINKILGPNLQEYQNSFSQEDSFEILKKAVKRSVIRTKMESAPRITQGAVKTLTK